MSLYYAPGGGMGHVTRARRVLQRIGIANAKIVARTSSAPDIIAIPEELDGDPAAHAEWLAPHLDGHLIVDTFPAGIQGELASIRVPRVDYVARLLRWHVYREDVPADAPRFHTTYVVEPLTDEHDEFVRQQSDAVAELDLHESPAIADSRLARYWLIVHSGPAEEVLELARYAAELRDLAGSTREVLVATPCVVELPDGFRRVDAVPATHLYPEAEKIITAAGFNVMLETEAHRDRCVVLPFPRRFDDQFLRAARRAGRVRPLEPVSF